VLCGGLGPGEEPGTWRPCKLEADHDSPCVPVPDPVQAELAKLRRECANLYTAQQNASFALGLLSDRIELLRGQLFDDPSEFGRGARWVIERLDAARSGSDPARR